MQQCLLAVTFMSMVIFSGVMLSCLQALKACLQNCFPSPFTHMQKTSVLTHDCSPLQSDARDYGMITALGNNVSKTFHNSGHEIFIFYVYINIANSASSILALSSCSVRRPWWTPWWTQGYIYHVYIMYPDIALTDESLIVNSLIVVSSSSHHQLIIS